MRSHVLVGILTAIPDNLRFVQGSLRPCRSRPICLPYHKLDSPQGSPNYYGILNVRDNASQLEIKAAYHRALLLHHPDKNQSPAIDHSSQKRSPSETKLDIVLIREAYSVLSDAQLRSRHDAILKQRSYSQGPRPAQVISLEEWTSTAAGPGDEDEGPWVYPCRCSGRYVLTLDVMERDEHLIGCDSCSEVVWAGYEVDGE